MDFISKLLHLNPGDKRNIPRNQSAKSGQLSADQIVHENSKDQLIIGSDKSLEKSTSEQTLTGSSSTFSSAVEFSSKEEFDTDGSPEYDSACENDVYLDQDVPNKLSLTLLAEDLEGLHISTPKSVSSRVTPTSSLLAFKIKESEHCDSSLVDSSINQSILNSSVDDSKSIISGDSVIENTTFTEGTFNSSYNIESTCRRNLSESYNGNLSDIPANVSVTSNSAKDTQSSFSEEGNKELTQELLSNKHITSSLSEITTVDLCEGNLSVQNSSQIVSTGEVICSANSIAECTKTFIESEIVESSTNLNLESDKNLSSALSVVSNVSLPVESSPVDEQNIDGARNSSLVDEELCYKNKPEVKNEELTGSFTECSLEKLDSNIIISPVLTNEEFRSTVNDLVSSQINGSTYVKLHNFNTVEDTDKNVNYNSDSASEVLPSDQSFSKDFSVSNFQTDVKSNKVIPQTHSGFLVHESASSTVSPRCIESSSDKLSSTAPVPIDESNSPKSCVIQEIKPSDLSTNIVPLDSVDTAKEIIGKTSPLPNCENKDKQDQSFEIVGTRSSGVVEQSFEIVEANLSAESIEKSFEVVHRSPVSDVVEKSFEVVKTSSGCELSNDKVIPQQSPDYKLNESNTPLDCSLSKAEEEISVVTTLSDSIVKTESSFNELKSDEKASDAQEILLNKVENNLNKSLSVVSHEFEQLSTSVYESQNISERVLTDNTAKVSIISNSKEVNLENLVSEEKLTESVESKIVTENNEISLSSPIQKTEPSSLEIVEKSFEIIETNLPLEIVEPSIEVIKTNQASELISDSPIQPVSDIESGKSVLPSESTEIKTEESTLAENIVPDSNLKTELSLKEQQISEFHDSLNKVENIVPVSLSTITDICGKLNESISNSEVVTEVTDHSNAFSSNIETTHNKLVIATNISETFEASTEHHNIVSSESPLSRNESNLVQSSDIPHNTSVDKGSEVSTVSERLDKSTGDTEKIKSTLDCSIIEGVNKLSVVEENNLNISSKSENCSEGGIIKRRFAKDISHCVTKADDFADESIVDVEFEGYKSSLDSSGDSCSRILKVNGELNGLPEEVDGQDFDADSIEELKFDESLAIEACKISETILNNSNDNIQEDKINEVMNTPVSAKSPSTEIFIGKGQSVSTFLNTHSDMNDYGKDEGGLNNSIGNDVQVTENSNFNLDVNNSEAGPATAEEFSNAASFQFDINYLSQVGQNSHRSGQLSSLTRQSLYVKFDPIVGKILSNTEESPLPSTESGERAFVTPVKTAEFQKDGQLIVFTPGPSNVINESCADDSDFNKSEAGPNTADNELSEGSNSLNCTIQKPDSSPKTPMKNSSIERKPSTPSTTTPTAPLEKSQSTPKSGQKTVVSQEVYHKEVQKLQDLMEQMVVQENKYKDELKSKNEQIEKLQTEVNEKNESDAKVQREIQDKAKTIKQLGLILEEYERTISQMLAQKEEQKKEFENQKEIILKERDTAMTHLNNMEIAFNDVHQKYERSKTVIEGMKNNEDILKASLQEYEATINKQEDKYNKLRAHAMAQLEKANLELDMLKRSHETEAARLNAIVKKSEIRITTLEEALDRKVKENLELTQLCDELISKVTGQSVENHA